MPIRNVGPWTAGAAIIVAYSIGVPPAWGPGPGIALFVLATVLLPGSILQKLLGSGKEDALSTATGVLLHGLGTSLVALFLLTLLGADARVAARVLPLASLAIVGLGGMAGRWARGRSEPGATAATIATDGGRTDASLQETPRPASGWQIATAIALVVLFVAVLSSGVPIDHTKDTLDHIAYVDEIHETGKPFPTTAFYAEGGDNGRDVRKGLLHYYYGVARHVTGAETLPMLNLWNALLAVVLALSVWTTARAWFGDARVAALSVLLLIAGVAGGIAGGAMRISYYPNRFGIAFLLFFVLHGLSYLRAQRRRDLTGAALAAFAAAATHIFYVIVVIAAGLVMKLTKAAYPTHNTWEHLRRVVVLGVGVVAAMFPYGLFRYLTAAPGPNDLHREIQGVLFLTDRLYVANPLAIWSWFGPVGVAAALVTIAGWRQQRDSAGLSYTMISLACVFLVLFNPILLPPLHDAMTYLVFRLTIMTPFYMLPAWYLVRYLSAVPGDDAGPHRRGIYEHIVAGVCLLAVAASLLPAVTGGGFGGAALEDERARSYRQWSDGLESLADIARPVVVASDPVTSYSVTAFTPHHVLCTLDQHAPPNDLLIEKRITTARDIVSPFVSLAETVELLNASGATHIALNGRLPRGMIAHYWLMNESAYAESRRKFDRAPRAFEPVFDRDDFVVYRWTGRAPVVTDSIETPNRLDDVPEGYQSHGVSAGRAVIEATRMTPSTCNRGGRLALDIVWSGSPPYALDNYVVTIRLDHGDVGLPAAGWPFPKIARKIKERLTGQRYRFRIDHKIHGGLLGPDTWSPGEYIPDAASVPIPLDMAPGVYTVSVKLLDIRNQPNYRVRDLLFDDDVYQGPAIGRVTIE